MSVSVFLSAMEVQKRDTHRRMKEAKNRAIGQSGNDTHPSCLINSCQTTGQEVSNHPTPETQMRFTRSAPTMCCQLSLSELPPPIEQNYTKEE